MCYINKAIKNDKVVKTMGARVDVDELAINPGLEKKAAKIINSGEVGWTRGI
jgi:hypothetical protein